MFPRAALCRIRSQFAPLQCLEATSPNQDKRVCDLKPGAQTIILLLSCITVSRRVTSARPLCRSHPHGSRAALVRTVACLQSWAMFAVNVTEIAKLKEKWQEQRELEAEVERMVSKLQIASPEIALQVEEMMLMSPRARKVISGEDATEIRQRASRRRSTVHHSTESEAIVTLASISPGGPPHAGDSGASVPQVSQEHPLAGRKVAFDTASGQPSSDESRRDEMAY